VWGAREAVSSRVVAQELHSWLKNLRFVGPSEYKRHSIYESATLPPRHNVPRVRGRRPLSPRIPRCLKRHNPRYAGRSVQRRPRRGRTTRSGPGWMTRMYTPPPPMRSGNLSSTSHPSRLRPQHLMLLWMPQQPPRLLLHQQPQVLPHQPRPPRAPAPAAAPP